MDNKITDEDISFKNILKIHDKECCQCGRELDRGDCSWNNAGTDAGTPYCVLNVICQQCDTEIVHVFSWWPEIEDFSDFVDILERSW